MNRSILLLVLFAAAAAALTAQDASQANQSDPYSGVSHPSADEMNITTSAPAAKPPAGQPAQVQAPAATAQPGAAPANAEPQPTSVDPALNFPGAETDNGTVQVEPAAPAQPALNQRDYANDPDGDIVHPHPLGPGELGEGTTIRVRLLERLSTLDSQKGEIFRTRVASDVLQGGQVLIPAGAEIDGKVMSVSSGQLGGHGSIRLRPDTVILPDGSRFHLFAEVTGTPGSKTHVDSENTVVPDSRLKRDGIEYGGAVGAGAVTGAFLGGPVGALTGSLIGAGAVTAHLLISHPQATLEAGTTLLFTLTDNLNLVPVTAANFDQPVQPARQPVNE